MSTPNEKADKVIETSALGCGCLTVAISTAVWLALIVLIGMALLKFVFG